MRGSPSSVLYFRVVAIESPQAYNGGLWPARRFDMAGDPRGMAEPVVGLVCGSRVLRELRVDEAVMKRWSPRYKVSGLDRQVYHPYHRNHFISYLQPLLP